MLPATLTDHLKRITTPGTGFLNGAVARLSPEGALDTFAHGRRRPGDAPGELEPDRMRVRVASVTKAATAHLACRLAVAGVVDLDDALAHALGVEPTGPQPTLRQLLNHSSGLRDARGYITEPPGTVRDLLTDALPPATPPGAYFEYANLNYVLLGAALEVATGERLDHLMRRE
ncbi:MAG: serine hydrolase domain-containing protein, partial [Pseudomonadota bacterium]